MISRSGRNGRSMVPSCHLNGETRGEEEFRAGIASPSGLELQEAMLGGSRGGQGKTKWRLGPK